MSKKLIMLFLLLFIINGCLYSCNYAPEAQVYKNTDPCNTDGTAEVLKFVNISSTKKNRMNIQVIMKLPCSPKANTFSLAVYSVNNFQEPTDLTNAKPGGWGLLSMVSCKEKDNEKLMKKVKENAELYGIMQGSAVTISTGGAHANRLYPYMVKTSIDSKNPLGSLASSSSASCFSGADFSPFILDSQTNSPIAEANTNNAILPNSSDVSLNISPYTLMGMGAPFYTYSIKNGDNDGGLKPIDGQTPEGSFFSFDIGLKSGQYYLVMSNVPDPMGAALSGNFSLKDVKIYNDKAPNKNKFIEYNYGAGTRITGNATAITVR